MSLALTQFSWSPNAEFLITTHGVSNQFPIAPIITRKDMEAKYIVMGPTKAVTVAVRNFVVD